VLVARFYERILSSTYRNCGCRFRPMPNCKRSGLRSRSFYLLSKATDKWRWALNSFCYYM